MPDHVHIAASIPPRLAVSDVVQRIKGSSSRALKEADRDTCEPWSGWQSEYGVLTFGERFLEQVSDCVRNQKSHRALGTLLLPYVQIDRREAH